MLGLQLVCLLLVSWQGWTPPGPWVYGTAFSTLFSRVVLGYGFASGFTVGSSDIGWVTRCMDGCGSHQVPEKASRSQGGCLGRQDHGQEGVELSPSTTSGPTVRTEVCGTDSGDMDAHVSHQVPG